jgi:hypothetical protein
MTPQTLPNWAKPTEADLNAAAEVLKAVGKTESPDTGAFSYHDANVAMAETLIARVLARMPAHPIHPDTPAFVDILAERDKQIGLGYTPENDDRYTSGDLVRAAECLLFAVQGLPEVARETWPWDNWQPACLSADTPPTAEDRRKMLVKAAALLVAELGRLDRTGKTAGAA